MEVLVLAWRWHGLMPTILFNKSELSELTEEPGRLKTPLDFSWENLTKMRRFVSSYGCANSHTTTFSLMSSCLVFDLGHPWLEVLGA
jgi:hypothetical protein